MCRRWDRSRLEHLRHDVADETMIGVAIAALRSPGEHGVRMQLGEDGLEPLLETVERFTRPGADHREAGVLQPDENRRLRAELASGTACLAGADGREAVAGRYAGVLRHPFASVGGDDDVHAHSLAC